MHGSSHDDQGQEHGRFRLTAQLDDQAPQPEDWCVEGERAAEADKEGKTHVSYCHTPKFPFWDVNLFPKRYSKFLNDFIIST
jgi:hypothetical protein